MKFSDKIKFVANKETGEARFNLEASESEIRALVAQMARSTDVDEHIRFGAALVPPIAQAIPYVEMYNIFFSDVSYADLDDNRLPVEKDVVSMAWETHADAEILFTRPGYMFTRPDFTEWDTGIEISWRTIRRAGWNVLDRAMQRATWELARKRDAQKKAALDTAIAALSGHASTVATALTKASVDSVLQSAAEIGYPILKGLTNPSTLMAMAAGAGWTWGSEGFKIPESFADKLLTTLYVGTYGGVAWHVNPHHATDYVYLGGNAQDIGYHQIRGSMQTASDVDIVKKADLHTIMDAEHATYIGNSYNLWRIQIT